MRSRVLSELLAVVVPPVCAVCRTPLRDARRVLCGACEAALPWLAGERCTRCALPLPCAPCPAADAAFGAAWAAMAHAGPARSLVSALKYHGHTGVVAPMAEQMLRRAPAGLLADAALVPVPLHPARLLARGFDQAELLARRLSRLSGTPLQCPLRRSGVPTRQVGAGAAARRADGRVRVRSIGPAPAVVVLVDDVHTTGATLDACARALRLAGAQRVGCFTYARALANNGRTPERSLLS